MFKNKNRRTKKGVVDLSSLESNWLSAYVAREEIYNFSGGLINPKTLANLDSQGNGPKGRIRVGRKVAYPVKSVIKWLEERSELI